MLSATNYDYDTWEDIYNKDHPVQLKDFKISKDWMDILKDSFRKSEYIESCFTDILHKIIYPYPSFLFAAFNSTPYNDLKVVILGQDPYHGSQEINGKQIPQAMGLSFSVPTGVDIPSSLRNIFRNLNKYNHLISLPKSGNLEFWATQGCLMLNTSLTVEQASPNSHQYIWEGFTNQIINNISDHFDDIIFVLWGAPALKKQKFIDTKRHKIIASSHPSGLSCETPVKDPFDKTIIYPAFMKQDHFGLINQYLKDKGKKEIIWQIV